jgi:hypothetical protein
LADALFAERNPLHPNPQSESRNPQSPITDSPWFWVLVFSLMALLALLAIGPKYGRRQTRLELQYQARERIAERRATENKPEVAARIDDQTGGREFASPGDNLIPLWPLAAVLVLIAIFSAVMLGRGRGRPGSLGAHVSS